IDWIDTNVSKNEEQMQAVINILHKTACPAPYIIFGPPGTGKTATLVEAICQIVKQDPTKHILVCTSSNAAADEITSRLLRHLPAQIMYRMYASSKRWEDVKQEIRKCANFTNSVPHTIVSLPKTILMLKKIIISTLITSIRLAVINFEKNHFSHIFIDEAGQAKEPEILIPLTLAKNNEDSSIYFQAQVVLAGDHHQLGPVIHSKIVQNILGKFLHGMACISMLERLMNDCELYMKKDGKYNPNYVTKLIKNYRSHECILHVPNNQFYNNELVCWGQTDTRIALGWKKLPNKKFPMIFQEVLGIEERSSKNSVFNAAEVHAVLGYVHMLMNAKFENYTISEKDIGIVTPFKKQQLDIMHRLAARGWKNVTVGTVETFQGQERTVMILTTVRSKIFTHNGEEHIGFLSNPKRFNVAVTRAKALLIIVGNPEVICKGEHWMALWKYCEKHNACVQFDRCPLRSQIIAKFKKLYKNQVKDISTATVITKPM
ncbi:Putative helicase MOV-10, partial [Harpegnathos saltator]